MLRGHPGTGSTKVAWLWQVQGWFVQCSKLRVHTAPGVHISVVGRTFFCTVPLVCWARASRSPPSHLRVQTLCGEDKWPMDSPLCESLSALFFLHKIELKCIFCNVHFLNANTGWSTGQAKVLHSFSGIYMCRSPYSILSKRKLHYFNS